MTVYRAAKIIRESIPVLCICAAFEIAGGQVLNRSLIIPLLMLVPMINGVGGNLGSVLGARLASGLHAGYIQPVLGDRELMKNIGTTLVLGLVTFACLSLVGYPVMRLLGSPIPLVHLVAIVFIAGCLLTVIEIISCIGIAIISYRRGLDPDDVVIPIVTTIGDLMGIICLFVAIGVVGI